jgi:hypothetical protein
MSAKSRKLFRRKVVFQARATWLFTFPERTMTKAIPRCAAICLVLAATSGPGRTESYIEYDAPLLDRHAPVSHLTGAAVFVPPYGPMPVRLYATPQLGAYYNVPPYPVIAPY